MTPTQKKLAAAWRRRLEMLKKAETLFEGGEALQKAGTKLVESGRGRRIDAHRFWANAMIRYDAIPEWRPNGDCIVNGQTFKAKG